MLCLLLGQTQGNLRGMLEQVSTPETQGTRPRALASEKSEERGIEQARKLETQKGKMAGSDTKTTEK